MMKKEILVVSFSGGKTSAFMCWYLICYWGHLYEFVFVFANTGREHEKTLEFVRKCDEYFGLNLNWLEAVIDQRKGKGVRHRYVNFETASRNGEPFEQYIMKEGVPNVSRATCTERLKTFVIKSFMREQGLITNRILVKTAIGMRVDEPDRCKLDSDAVRRHKLVYPLAHWEEFDKQDVNDFWDEMPFTLEIPERYGNCLTCFKKSDTKLKLIAREHPEWYEWNDRMENQYGDGHTFFRSKRSTRDIMSLAGVADLEMLKHLATNGNADKSSDCNSGSCEPFK